MANGPQEIFHEFWAWCTPKSHLRTIFSVWKYNAKHHEFEKMFVTECSNAQLLRCSNTQMLKSCNAQMLKYSNAQILQC